MFEALQHVMNVFPFPIIGVDPDTGSEFINEHLFHYRVDDKITRIRPGGSTATTVPTSSRRTRHTSGELTGHFRCDAPTELAKLNEIREFDRAFMNLLPSQGP